MEIKAEVILKATRVDGIYDADPEQVKDAQVCSRRLRISTRCKKPLKVMDSTAISLCMDNKMPIRGFQYESCREYRSAW